MKKTLNLELRLWKLCGNVRQYVQFNIPFSEAKEYFVSKPFNALTGEGSQRVNFDSQIKLLKKAMENGSYTPETFHVSAYPDSFVINNSDVQLNLDSDNPIELINGDHRMSVLKQLRTKFEEDADRLEEIDSLPIPVIVYLDGDPKKDFVNLQLGRAVDSAHMFSMQVQEKLFDPSKQELAEFALELAKELDASKDSPFYHQIKFDSRRLSGLPIASLCQKGSSDIATSFIGLSKVALQFNKDVEWCKNLFIQVMDALKNANIDAIKDDGFFCFPPEGTKGSATMLISLVVLAAYNCLSQNINEISDDELNKIVEAVKAHGNDKVNGNFSSPVKRSIVKNITSHIFSNNAELHEGVPVGLVKTLSTSTFGISKLPKAPKQQPAEKVEVEVETVDVTTENIPQDLVNELNNVANNIIDA